MSRLFASVYLDEDVDVLLAALVRSQGWTALTAAEAGTLGDDDETQLQFAADQKMVIVTHNRDDFQELANAWGAAAKFHAGIVIAVRRHTTYDVARRLLLILNQDTADEMENRAYYI